MMDEINKYNKNRWYTSWPFFLFVFIPVCKPYTVQQLGVLDDIFDLWGLVVFSILIII